jgi:hypothetical protein
VNIVIHSPFELGVALLELAGEPEMAPTRTLRGVRGDDQSTLGWNHRLVHKSTQSLF